MMEILTIPPLATVQDLGREGHLHEGLGRAGAMDPIALRLGNLLLGNDPGAAAIELPLTPARVRFVDGHEFALVGAICDVSLDGIPLPPQWAHRARAGQVLEIGTIRSGCRVYLCLAGGIGVAPVLGSRSTQLREGFGGHEGRMLRSGDRLEAADDPVAGALPAGGLGLDLPDLLPSPANRAVEIRALPGPEHDGFDDASREAFWSAEFKVTAQSNRLGYRLAGPELRFRQTEEMRSHGIVPGVVQVPGGGQPIVQLADAATMGGYPKIASVIEPDLGRIAQIPPGGRLRFRKVDLAEVRRVEAGLAESLARISDKIGQARRLAAAWG